MTSHWWRNHHRITKTYCAEILKGGVKRSITGNYFLRILDWVTSLQRYPALIRMDNGPLWQGLRSLDGAGSVRPVRCFIELRAPWQNASADSFNNKLHDNFLAIQEIRKLLEVKVAAENL